MITKSRAEKEAEKAAMEASRKKHKGKKRKIQEEVYEEFNFDLSIIKMFSTVSVNPPNKTEQLDQTIKKVQDKKQWYIDNGESKLREQIEEMKRQNEEEDKEYEEEVRQGYGAAAEDYKEKRRGRGGYKGVGRVNEFDGGEDDDDQAYAAPTRVQRKQNKKKEDLTANDENFPAFGE